MGTPAGLGILVKLAVAAACLAAALGILLLVFSPAVVFVWGPVAAILAATLAALLAVGALWDTVVRHNRRGVGLSAVALTVAGIVLVWSVFCLWREMHEFEQSTREYWTTVQVHYAVVEYYDSYKHAPKTLDDLIRAGLLKGDVDFLHTYFLAPLDDRFLDSGLWLWQVPDKDIWYDILCAYRPAGEGGERGWLYVDEWGHAGNLRPPDVVEWLRDQREAITWLDDSFPLADLERIAQTATERRGRLAKAILGYRREQAAKKAPESQEGGHRRMSSA